MNSRMLIVGIVLAAATLAEAQQPVVYSAFDTNLFGDGNKVSFGPGVLQQRTFGLREPISLEAQIAGDVPLWGQSGVRDLEQSALTDAERRWASQGYATMMLRLRMMATTSAPVAPPSFMPKFTYRGVGFKRGRILNSMVVINAVFGHHSNGQSGCSLVNHVFEEIVADDGRKHGVCLPAPESTDVTSALNVATGNFSTHYIQASAYHRLIRVARGPGRPAELFYGIAIEQHQFGMKGAISAELAERYGMTQIEGVLGTSMGSVWIFDRVDGRLSYRHVLGDVTINRAVAAEYFLYFKARPDVGLFFRNYSGRDYYNINFEQYLRRIEIGLTFNWESILRAVPGGL